MLICFLICNVYNIFVIRIIVLITFYMTPPNIVSSTEDERRAFVLDAWKCLHDCESCGKCRILRGKDAETLYADYIAGIRSYMDITLSIRNTNY